MTATVRIDGNIAAILGVGRLDLLSGIGLPWFVGTPEIERPAAAVPMVRLIRRFLLHWLTVFPRLENVADPDHVTALRLLAWVGFTIEPAQVRGPLGHNLVYFWRQRACA